MDVPQATADLKSSDPALRAKPLKNWRIWKTLPSRQPLHWSWRLPTKMKAFANGPRRHWNLSVRRPWKTRGHG